MTYAFTFDASACTGCKACQVACKDKNNLPVGVLWRRVFEVAGGGWRQTGEAWEHSVFAYNLSLACNHCVHPKCAGVCPTDAFVQRADGIVYIDESKCMGCGYCAWACPYNVPQYNPALGRMTKCNFCMDELDQGKPPACVAACPMRVLDFVTVDGGQQTIDNGQLPAAYGRKLWELPAAEHPFPLPTFSRTQPHLAIKPHAAMSNNLEKEITNREEVQTAKASNWRELPLVLFTLLGQTAAGMAFASLFFQPSILHILIIGILLTLGGLISFQHLGTKRNAWRAILHLEKSWLSREILAFGLFGISWLVWGLEHWLMNTNYSLMIAAPLGLGLVFSMGRVYHLHAVSGWYTWRTETAFFLSAGTLGTLATVLLLGNFSFLLAAIPFLAGEAALILSMGEKGHETASRLRLGLIAGCIVGVWAAAQKPESPGVWIIVISILILTEEILGRWLFYQEPHRRAL